MLVSQGSGTLSGNATLKYTNSDGVTGRTASGFTMKPGDTLKAEETVYVKAVVAPDSYPTIHVIKD
jgi:hypothetical protein